MLRATFAEVILSSYLSEDPSSTWSNADELLRSASMTDRRAEPGAESIDAALDSLKAWGLAP
jgi:hypothetical protein